MNAKIVLAAALAALAAAPALAASQGPPPSARSDRCFWTSQTRSFAPLGDRAVNVRVSTGDVYQLQLTGRCPNVDWTRKIGLESSRGSRICVGDRPEVVTTTSLGPLRCAVSAVRRLTPAQVKALPEAALPR